MKMTLSVSRRAYSLLEVLIAAAILMIAAIAFTTMALMVATQRESNVRIARSLNMQEQAARLYQLGLSPAEILAILPPDSAVSSLAFGEIESTAIGDIGGLERTTCQLTFIPSSSSASPEPGTWSPGNGSASRTNLVIVVRPSIR